MNPLVEKIYTEENFNLHVIQSEKFKTINIVAKFRAPLNRNTITKRALLPYILLQGTKSYPSEKELQLKLNNLYGTVLSIDGAKKGDNHIISVRLEVANQKYIANESSFFDEALTLFNEIIFQPHTINNAFEESVVDREKETLLQKMNAVIDDKMAYANLRLIDEMCKDEAYELHVHGYEEDLSSINSKNSYEYYQRLLSEDQLDIYVLGDFDNEEMKEKFTSTLVGKTSENMIHNRTSEQRTKSNTELKEVIDRQNIQQAKLHLGYRTNSTFADDDYPALQVFNGLYGGFPSSKLFINVREKNSLAYYAASRIESHKGILLVFSGIAASDYKKAREIIELQMTAMKKGEFSDQDLKETKQLIVNQLLETLDSPQGIIELLYQQVIGNKKVTPEELIDYIKEVTKTDVINVANKIEEDTVYLLTSEEGDSNE